ncbi:DUF5683 domain-containing protein [Methanohalophilus mahii]|uniref:TM2 domain containing protein n=1 Tax=Methanohalophilus mahii (strain ATCC 35705 / DSM 5219 / SLP) TaxID=547558 RepID=D5E6Y2_METMS|nr:DUF5683 domain-containing protein [Methanohalophilus mahii]ADE36920.1 TM2 domain containing protein [Methanohalophilus mahii DSM 5219]
MEQNQQKSPLIAIILSFIFPGLGQIYIGQQQKGVLFIVIGICLVLMMYILIGIVLYPLFWLYSMYDAYTSATKLNANNL